MATIFPQGGVARKEAFFFGEDEITLQLVKGPVAVPVDSAFQPVINTYNKYIGGWLPPNPEEKKEGPKPVPTPPPGPPGAAGPYAKSGKNASYNSLEETAFQLMLVDAMKKYKVDLFDENVMNARRQAPGYEYFEKGVDGIEIAYTSNGQRKSAEELAEYLAHEISAKEVLKESVGWRFNGDHKMYHDQIKAHTETVKKRYINKAMEKMGLDKATRDLFEGSLSTA